MPNTLFCVYRRLLNKDIIKRNSRLICLSNQNSLFLPGKPILKKNLHRVSVKWDTTREYNLLFLLSSYILQYCISFQTAALLPETGLPIIYILLL